MTKDKKTTEEPQIEELSHDELDQTQGGAAYYKLTDVTVVSKSTTGITADQKTIIGGFKSMSGMSSETE